MGESQKCSEDSPWERVAPHQMGGAPHRRNLTMAMLVSPIGRRVGLSYSRLGVAPTKAWDAHQQLDDLLNFEFGCRDHSAWPRSHLPVLWAGPVLAHARLSSERGFSAGACAPSSSAVRFART